MDFTQIIIKPLFTEKSQILKENIPPQYVFMVHVNANKHQIRMAFQQLFGFKPLAINTSIRKPKPTKRMLKGQRGYTKLGKLAYVTVPQGVALELAESAKEESKK